MRKIHKDRFIAYALDTSERPRMQYEYFVTGTGTFPFDMLRYDSAWPISGEDAAKLEWEFANPEHALRKHRSIKLRSYREPTIDRWSSFNWSVGKNSL
jgi:hypothetical protein